MVKLNWEDIHSTSDLTWTPFISENFLRARKRNLSPSHIFPWWEHLRSRELFTHLLCTVVFCCRKAEYSPTWWESFCKYTMPRSAPCSSPKGGDCYVCCNVWDTASHSYSNLAELVLVTLSSTQRNLFDLIPNFSSTILTSLLCSFIL